MQLDLYKETQLKCSIGVSITKFWPRWQVTLKPMGLTIIRKSEIKKYLFPLKIEAMYGIGKKTAPRLRSLGINTIGDLYDRIVKQEKQTIELLGKSEGVIRD